MPIAASLVPGLAGHLAPSNQGTMSTCRLSNGIRSLMEGDAWP